MSQKIIETWNKKRVFVIRNDKGRIVTWRYVKGSRLTKQHAIEIYKKNKTFYEDREKLSNVSIQSRLDQTKGLIENKTFVWGDYTRNLWRKGTIVYVVAGDVIIDGRPKRIYASSGQDGTKEQRVERARRNFALLVSQAVLGQYDEDEGNKALIDVQNIQEGWERYV